MFYVFFYEMSSLENVPHPCSLLSLCIWEQTAVTLSRVPFAVRGHHLQGSGATHRSICPIERSVWSAEL